MAIGPQIDKLDRGAQIAIATPGRMLDHMERGTVDLSHLRFAVLDEADRMLDMGFIDDVERILGKTPKTRQTTLFSATMPEKIVYLSQRYMNEPETLLLQQDEVTVKKIRQQVLGIDRRQKIDQLMKILRDQKTIKTIIFVNTKDWAERLSKILWNKRLKVCSIHSKLSQARRSKVIEEFNDGKYTVLVATDVAARGLHIDGVTLVINYDIPRNPKDYVHRIGRTGRAGKEGGDAITFVTQVDEGLLKAVEQEINMFLEVQYMTPGGKRPEPVVQHHTPHAGQEVAVHTHTDTSGDDWGLD